MLASLRVRRPSQSACSAAAGRGAPALSERRDELVLKGFGEEGEGPIRDVGSAPHRGAHGVVHMIRRQFWSVPVSPPRSSATFNVQLPLPEAPLYVANEVSGA